MSFDKAPCHQRMGGGGVPRVLSLPGPDGSRGLRTGTASRHLRYLQAVKVEIYIGVLDS